MLKNNNILLIAYCIFTLSIPVYAGSLNFGSSHSAVKYNSFSHHKTKHTSQSYAKHRQRFHRKWHHKTKSTNKSIFPYYVYSPPYASYGIEEKKNTDIYIVNDKKDEQIESTVNQDKPFSPPHIVNLGDSALPKVTNRLKTSNKQENVILIYGTKAIETIISSD